MCATHQPDTSNTSAGAPPALELLAQATTKGTCCGAADIAVPAAQAQGYAAECPVMTGTQVNKAHAEAAGLYRDYNGQRYWFCCAGCGPIWDADPDEYATA